MKLKSAMGSCLSSEREKDRGRRSGGEDNDSDNVRRPTFIEKGDGDEWKKGDGRGDNARWDSRLSRYSTESQHVVERPSRLGAFNVRRFGRAKAGDAEVCRVLARVVRRYDLLAVVEVSDASGEAAQQLLEEVNGGARNGDEGEYDIVASPRLGRTKNKEQTVVFYKTSRFKVIFVIENILSLMQLNLLQC